MSAGGIDYNCIVGSRKVTLPSVEMWGTNMNILKDPNKGIFTRKIDKVGQTLDITEAIDASGDRICESIKLFPRGVNPSVSVSYNNYGTNGGQNRQSVGPNNINNGSCSNPNGVGQAFLPYRIMRDGEFRPPMYTQEQLLPLSRLPRSNTQAFTSSDFPNYAIKMDCPSEKNLRAINKQIIRTSVRPTACYKLEKPEDQPLKENFEVKYVISNPIKFPVSSGIRTMDITQIENLNPVKEINNDYKMSLAQTQLGSSGTVKGGIENINFNTDKYVIDDTLTGSFNTNMSRDIQVVPSNKEDLDIRTKNPLNFSYNAPISGTEKEKYIHEPLELEQKIPQHSKKSNINYGLQNIISHENEIQLERNMPNASFVSNKLGIGGDTYSNYGNNVNLRPSLKKGGFKNEGVVPVFREDVPDVRIDTRRKELSDKAFSHFQDRFMSN